MSHITRRNLIAATIATTFARPSIVRAAEPLNVSVVLANSVHWVQFVAAEKGFYRDAGFAANILPLQSSAQSIQSLLADDLQMATAQPDTFIAAVYQGATDLAAMSAPTNANDWLLVGSKSTKTIQDLKGKSIGLSGLRASEEWLTGLLLEQHGMQRTDCNFILAGTSAAKAAALVSGGLAAAVLFEPSAEFAVRQGLPELARFDTLRSYPTILYIVKRSWASQGDAGLRASGALQKAHAWLWDPGNKAEALEILKKYTKRDADILSSVYEAYFVTSKSYSHDGKVSVSGLQAVLRDMTKDGRVFKTAPDVQSFLLSPKMGGLAA